MIYNNITHRLIQLKVLWLRGWKTQKGENTFAQRKNGASFYKVLKKEAKATTYQRLRHILIWLHCKCRGILDIEMKNSDANIFESGRLQVSIKDLIF